METGNARVPQSYIEEDGFTLGRWISQQRSAYKKPGRLSAHRFDRLQALDGWEWSTRFVVRREWVALVRCLGLPSALRVFAVGGVEPGRETLQIEPAWRLWRNWEGGGRAGVGAQASRDSDPDDHPTSARKARMRRRNMAQAEMRSMGNYVTKPVLE